MKSLTAISVVTIFVFSSCFRTEDVVLKTIAYQPVQVAQCDNDTINKYHISAPKDLAKTEKIPLLIVIDAHGDGKMAVEKFLPAIEYFPCIVVGSDLIENNFPGFESAIRELIFDVTKKYPVDENEIVLAGFSGGARMAYSFSLRHPLKGLLMCAAGPGKELPNCAVYAISGMGDFNFAENFIPPSIAALSDEKFNADYFHGNHEWPQPEQLEDGLLFLLSAKNEQFITLKNNRSSELLEIADSLTKQGNEWMAWTSLVKATKLAENKKTKRKTIEQANLLLENKTFLSTVETLEKDLSTEAALQKAYSQRSMTENFAWWKKELTTIKRNLEKYKNGMQADHYLRIKGFIGILLYSRINNMIYNYPDNPQLTILLEVYHFAEPENSYTFYFTALHAYKQGDNKSCIENLNRSLKLGFTDTVKLKKDFPENIVEQVQ